jgi:hypothetical protein
MLCRRQGLNQVNWGSALAPIHIPVQAIHLLLVHLWQRVGDFVYAKQSRALNAHGSMPSMHTTPSQYHSAASRSGARC